MANPGGAGSKFMSVNLNKSYGPSSHHQNSSSSYGQAAAGRIRTSPHGGAGSGGMVVLSRPKSSQKTAPKLSVPPPLNLPSMRKEHERFDLSGAGSSSNGGSGTVPRPTSSGMGWTKTGASVGLQDKDGKLSGEAHVYEQGIQVVPDVTRGTSSSNGTGIQGSISTSSTTNNPVLRGEDFPSLQAALPTPSSGPVQRAKDSLQKTHKHVTVDDSFPEPTDGSLVKPLADIGTHRRSPIYSYANDSDDNNKINGIYGLGSSHSREQLRKHEEYLPGSFPLIRLNPRSDWADDERDTGNKFSERSQNYVSSKSDAQWNGEFDIPKHHAFPAKSVQYERWSHRNDTKAKIPHSEATKSYLHQTDVVTPNMQRTSSIVKHVPYLEEVASDRNGTGERSIGNKYVPPHFGDNLLTDRFMVNQGSFPGRKDFMFAQDGRHQWNQDRYRNEQSHRNHANTIQNNPMLKSSYSANKWAHVNDSVRNYPLDKPPVSKVDRSYPEDSFLTDHGVTNFDEINPLTGTIHGVIKRKKDVKQTDFHDPVRESFEAELERVQQMQEKERQRIYQEQERAIEQARREEEERQRMIREEEEHHRRLEEEARVAARREEQERLDAIRIAEEQRIARDEEKQRILMEEERSKERARQKLLELEARIAQRQSEAAKSDPTPSRTEEKDKEDIYRTQEADNWEDSERMVERITTSAHSESSSGNRLCESDLRPQPPFQDDYTDFPDRTKPSNIWRRNILENGNNSSFIHNEEDNGHRRSTQIASSIARALPRKELHGRNSHVGVTNHVKAQRWNSTVSGDVYNKIRETNNDFDGHFAERYAGGWGEGHFRCNPSHSSFAEHQSSETDELYSYTRSRYPMKQPRVLLPPPSLESIRKTSIRIENGRPSSSSFGNDDMHYNHRASRSKPSLQRGYYNTEQENAEASANVETCNTVLEQRSEERSAIRCDSQSSLSLSSPPDSPVHLSHDDLDEYGDSPVITEGKEVTLSANEMFEKENPDALLHCTSAASVHEDWTPEDERDLLGQEVQEEYDEDEDGYNEEEIHEGNDEQMGLTHEFKDLHLELEDGGDSLVLGFNDGVEVSIPNDDEFDKNSKNEGSAFGISVVQVQEQDRFDRPEYVEENLEPVSGVSVMDTEDSSRMIEETETSKQDFVTQPVSEVYGLPSSSDMMTTAAVPSSNQTELPPSKLHFGLFSGPPLIPPPFPAIQIGSIQMPLHLHSTGGPTLSHLHSSQQSFLQFGQFSYASPISQGILPFAPKSVSTVQSNNGYISTGLLSIQPDQENSSYNITNNAQMQKGQAVSPQPNINKVNEFTSLVDGERNLVSDFLKETITEKESGGSKALDSLSGSKGNRSDYLDRNADSRSSRYFSTGIQRKPRHTTQRAEFKVWESVDKKQSSGGQVSSNHYFRPKDEKSNFTGRATHDYVKREPKNGSNRLRMKHTDESLGSGSSNSHGADPARRSDMKMVEQRLTHSGDVHLKINAILPGEYEDAPLQSGVVRVFKQSGIEAPSDEDDFIEVRSKRQMFNVRREQREKEIKAKSRVPKAPRRLRTTPQTAVSARSNQSTISVGSQMSKIIRSDFGSERKILANVEVSTGVQTIVSPPLAPIGTPAVSSNVQQADKRQHNVKTVSTDGEGLGSGVIFQSKNKILDSIQTSLSSWNNNSRINEQVLSLTRTQLDDAMKPHKYETSVTSIMGPDSTKPDVPTKDKIFPSATNPINSLLAGEKIQFGAVTSPSILLPTNCVVNHGNGAPGSSHPDIEVSQNVAATKNDTAILFNKDKHPNNPCSNLDVSEAEAAASAVAASSNEVNVGNGLLGDSSIAGLTVVDQPLDGQLRAEDSLSVSLPADLSVENPPISFWPGLPSPHSSSSQLLPHFSGGGPSHFPFFEMNQHMLGGPIFAVNRQDEPSSGSQQSQNNGVSTPLGPWQQCHSGIESFYGCPPTGFTGPFLNSPGGGGGGVQGLPPHMVVYNHFAPVGQYGGLSFMGTTYIPSGKQQPDWKHNHLAAGIINEGGDVMVNAQGIPPPSLTTTTAQHLASSLPLLSLPSPLPIFDASPYQPAPDMSVQNRWSHIPTPSLAVLQQNNESTRPPPTQFSEIPPPNVDQVSSRSFSMQEKTGSSLLLDSSMVKPDHLSSVSKTKPDSSNNNNSHMKSNNGFKWQQQQQKKNMYNNQHHHNQYQRKNMGSEWSSSNQNHHRMGVHGRNQSVGGDKTHPSSSTKMKQVYVAKQNPSTQNPTSG